MIQKAFLRLLICVLLRLRSWAALGRGKSWEVLMLEKKHSWSKTLTSWHFENGISKPIQGWKSEPLIPILSRRNIFLHKLFLSQHSRRAPNKPAAPTDRNHGRLRECFLILPLQSSGTTHQCFPTLKHSFSLGKACWLVDPSSSF